MSRQDQRELENRLMEIYDRAIELIAEQMDLMKKMYEIQQQQINAYGKRK